MYVDFPDDWTLLEREGVGPFTTRVVHRLPDGSKHVWTSRRHRKGRSGRILSGDTDRPADASNSRENPWFSFWAPGRITWWVAVSFVLGSLLFIAGSGAPLLKNSLGESLSSFIADWSYFLGATLFTGAIYLQILETINSDPHPIEARRSPREKFRWFAWQPDRLSFLAVFLLFIGSSLFNLETGLALLGVSGKSSVGWLISVPSFLGALLFVVSTYMQVVETCHRYLCLELYGISWWSTALNLLGSVGFVTGAFFGFNEPGLSTAFDPTIVKVSYLYGSVLFLAGSYLLFPEMFSE